MEESFFFLLSGFDFDGMPGDGDDDDDAGDDAGDELERSSSAEAALLLSLFLLGVSMVGSLFLFGTGSISTVLEITIPSPFSSSAVVIVVTTRSLDGMLIMGGIIQ